jgi:hypothetical protein
VENRAQDHKEMIARLFEEVGSKGNADAAAEFYAPGDYPAFDGDTPVAIASLRMQDGIGWLGNGATLPSHRRRGAHGALMARRIRDGIKEMQCEWFVTEADQDTAQDVHLSNHNMLRPRFKFAYLRANYVHSGTTSN